MQFILEALHAAGAVAVALLGIADVVELEAVEVIAGREVFADGDEVGKILPMASKRGRLNITPAPRRNVRRGIRQLFFSISIGQQWDAGERSHIQR